MHHPFPSISSPTIPLLNLSPVSSIWEASFRRIVAQIWGQLQDLRGLSSLWQDQSYPLVPEENPHSDKASHFSSVIIPTLLYGTECAALLQPHIHRLQSFIMRCLRLILGISVWDMKCNTTIHKLAQQWLSSLLLACRLRFLDHISRVPDSRLPKQLLV